MYVHHHTNDKMQLIVQTPLVKMVTMYALIMLIGINASRTSALYNLLLVCTYGLKMLQVCSMCDGGFEYCNFHLYRLCYFLWVCPRNDEYSRFG